MLDSAAVDEAIRNLPFPGYGVSDELTAYLWKEKELTDQFHEYLNFQYGDGLNEFQQRRVHAFTLNAWNGSDYTDYEAHYAAAAQLVREALSEVQ